jgi:two-component system, OmpR family, response regulator
MIITQHGYPTDIELDSRKALERIRSAKPDLVILDIMMEPLTGWEVLEQIRGDTELSDIPVLILTGKRMIIREALQFGMQIDEFVMKPLRRSMLITAIDEVWRILADSEIRYNRAIDAGLSERQAGKCRRMIRKRKMLIYLKDFLIRQEQIFNIIPDEESDIKNAIEQLRMMIESESKEFAQVELICP